MKKALSLLLIAVVLTVGTFVSAAPVDKTKAQAAAISFLKAKGVEDLQLVDITGTTPYTAFYIFAGSDGKGFVIVSADDCVLPILGYSTSGTFVTEGMPSNVKGWLDDYERQILHYRNLGPGRLQSVRDEGCRVWMDLLEGNYNDPPQNTAVSPLLSTTWNQTQYYNNLCPNNSYLGERTVTGCVATAMAQVMKYWNHPATGHGSHSYSHSYYGTLSANFGSTTYAWTSMPSQLTSSSTTAQRTAVATLMYHVGVAMEMNYDVADNGGSGALAYSNGDPFEPSAENALRTYFKYKSSLRQVSIDDYSNADWSALLMSELNASRPILYSGRDSTGGHCFVYDGYDNGGQFHINWGWGGWCDGYYAIGSLNPSSGGTGGNASSTFNLKNVAVIGIEPNSSFGSTTTVTATSNNTSYGTVTGGGTFTGTNTDTVALYATAAPGCRFTGWNDEHQFTPRAFLANGGNYSFVANFEPLSGDTLGYCKRHCITSLGSGYGTSYWGIRLPASVLTAGHDLTKVMMYVSSAGAYTLTVYTGTTSPATAVYTQNFNAPASLEDHWGVLTLNTPVAVDGSQSLWITLSSSASYPAAMSYSSGNNDATLWGSSFTPSGYEYSFMIRGIFAEREEDPVMEGDTLSYCGDSTMVSAIGAGGSLTWGVRFMPATLTGHSTLTDVRLFVYRGGTYTLNIYQGTTTESANMVASQTYTFGSSADSSWQNCHLSAPVSINASQPLWVVFSNTGVTYPAAICNYVGDSNSSLVYFGSTWYSLYTASGGELNGSWMIQAITGSGGSPSVLGDTVDYCGDNVYYTSVGTGSALTWGIRLPPAMHSHRHYLTDVMLYVHEASTYTLNVYQGALPSSTSCLATQVETYVSADLGMWKTIHLTAPVTLDSTLPLWITFSTTTASYPAAMCNLHSDTNNSLLTVDNGATWYDLYTASGGELDGAWMIRAILSNSNTPSIVISGPATAIVGNPTTFTASGVPSGTYSWTLTGATPSTATGATVTATWSVPGTYNVIVSSLWGGSTLRDTLVVTVIGCTINSFPYTMGFEANESLDCWTMIDNDGDGYGWTQLQGVPRTGVQTMASASYINDVGVLTPDNWLVTPPVQLASGHDYTLTWYDGGVDENYYNEHYSVYVSTTGNQVVDFSGTPVFQTTLTTSNFTQRSVDLSGYAGMTIYIAFRHHNSTDVYWLQLDDLAITESIVQTHTLTVLSADPTMGSATGGGTYPHGTAVTIMATPEPHYRFVQWQDGNTDAMRTVTVNSDATYTAYFAADQPQTYTITAIAADPSMGVVEGGGEYEAGASVVLTARPFAGYRFVHWQDNATTNPRTITVTGDATYTATFQSVEGIDHADGGISVAALEGRIISVAGAENSRIDIYDVVGRHVCGVGKAEALCQFAMPHTGVYLVAVGNSPVRRVVVVK